MKIINLTQHTATTEQVAAGVFDLPARERATLQSLLTFEDIPNEAEILDRSRAIAGLTAPWVDWVGDETSLTGDFARSAMIGGALWLMAPLAAALRLQYMEPVFAFSRRETMEQTQPDGSVRKTMIFRHAGFVPAVA